MTQRSAFQVQILEKLGAPLTAAAAEVAARQNQSGEGAKKQEAECVAELLGKAVQVGIGLSGSMDIKEAGAQGDAVRLALAALAGPLVAGQYRATGKMPGDNEIKRMVKALEAVLTFADSFAPAAENTARLENMDAAAPADESQLNIQYVGALVPVINVIAAFPFGRAEGRLAQEVAERLVKRAAAMKPVFVNGVADQAARQAELSILKSLAALYVECHRAEMNRLTAMEESARAKMAESAGGMLPMDAVWQAFEMRAAMAEIIGRSAAVPAGQGTTAGSSSGPQPVAAVPPPAPPQVSEVPPAEEGAFNPMGAFTKKKPPADGGSGEGG